ncbi:FAD-linked oxidase-like protein [Armillaria borealis]|uniref:FAD-linked oxidase-like protein n=1 Tax=Armillaria borealis TaxID=47425 RepID=A0AA39ICB1_9AGAR|nr:FAD-linked oxidase-like protein [Armillaria borealis]
MARLCYQHRQKPDAFFADCTARFGPIFRVVTAGKKMTFITSSNLIGAVYRNVKIFEYTPIRKAMAKTVFELSHDAVYSGIMQQEYIPIHHRLLSQTAIPVLLLSMIYAVYSCQIGGNVATNAGGLRLLRYGSLHGSILGLEVVLPDGTILDQLTSLRKDNTGYDLKQLFIGAEGTLGIITCVSIITPPSPQASNNVIFALPHFDNVLPLYQMVKRQLSEILSAFEFIDRTAYDLAVKHGQGRALSDEDVEGAQCFVLVETSGGRREHDEEKLTTLLETLLEADKPLINTGVLAQSPAQFSSLRALREGVTEAVSKEGKAYKYDISVPLSTFKECVDITREHLRSKGLMREGAVRHVIGYGHVGDGNLHLNVVADTYSSEIQDALEPFIYELVASHRGSVSAEHGIGAMKTHALHYSKSAVSIAWMKKIKELFDPRGIMNPGKVLE